MKFLVVLLSFLYLLQQRVVSGLNFNRIAFFPVCRQLDPTCNTDNVTNAEILSVSTDGLTVIYGDSESGAVGFVDIADPYNPAPLGFVDVGGEPTSLGVTGDYVVVAVNTSPDFVNVSGVLYIINIDTQEVLRTMDLEGQPDSVAISPDQRFVAIAIENERNEDLEDGGGLPQLPAGFLNILVTESDDVMEWELSKVELTGLDGPVEPDDPEPEYVDINDDNICVLTLQENNGIVLIDLEAQAVISSFTAGTVDLTNIDVIENDVIYQNSSATLSDLPREPDGVTWISTENFVTSDEGDWLGGTRGFTVYDKEGNIVYTSAEELETLAIKYGHYPEGRAENKGNEPENVEFAVFGEDHILFVNSERSSLIFVYDISDPSAPVFLQALPAGLEPEGGKAIPERNLYVVASEVDDRGGKVRAGITVYERSDLDAVYPTLVSEEGEDGNPIPFSALSGLAAAEPYRMERRRQLTKDGLLRKNDVPRKVSVGRRLRSRKLEGESPVVEFDEEEEEQQQEQDTAEEEDTTEEENEDMAEEEEENEDMAEEEDTAAEEEDTTEEEEEDMGEEGEEDIVEEGEEDVVEEGEEDMVEEEDTAPIVIEKKEDDNPILYSIEDSFYKKNRIFEIDTSTQPNRITKAMHVVDSNGVFASALGDEGMVGSLINDDNTVNIDPEGIAVSSKGGFWLAHEGSGTIGDEARPFESPNLLFKLDETATIEQVVRLPTEVDAIQVRFGFEGVAEDGDYVVVAFQRAWGDDANPRLGIYNTETEEWKFVFYPLDEPESQNGGWVGLSDIAPLGNGQFLVLERDNQGGEDAAIKRLFSIDLGDFSVEDGSTISKVFFRDLIPSITAYNGAIIEKVEGLAVTKGGKIWINTDNDGVDDNSGEQLLIRVDE